MKLIELIKLYEILDAYKEDWDIQNFVGYDYLLKDAKKRVVKNIILKINEELWQ